MDADNPIPFGYKCAWLAIQTDDPDAVVSTLGLMGVRNSNWKQGIESAYRGEVFVTPVINDWVLTVSNSLPEYPEKKGKDNLTPLIGILGKKFTNVQYFGTHRVVDYHAWLLAKNGKIIRRYAFLGEKGETLCDEGELTTEEKELLTTA